MKNKKIKRFFTGLVGFLCLVLIVIATYWLGTGFMMLLGMYNVGGFVGIIFRLSFGVLAIASLIILCFLAIIIKDVSFEIGEKIIK